jgi:hypothetical protein
MTSIDSVTLVLSERKEAIRNFKQIPQKQYLVHGYLVCRRLYHLAHLPRIFWLQIENTQVACGAVHHTSDSFCTSGVGHALVGEFVTLVAFAICLPRS